MGIVDFTDNGSFDKWTVSDFRGQNPGTRIDCKLNQKFVIFTNLNQVARHWTSTCIFYSLHHPILQPSNMKLDRNKVDNLSLLAAFLCFPSWKFTPAEIQSIFSERETDNSLFLGSESVWGPNFTRGCACVRNRCSLSLCLQAETDTGRQCKYEFTRLLSSRFCCVSDVKF